jgi:solute carrier family 10 (sodium/bile acid cotransporter), member 7
VQTVNVCTIFVISGLTLKSDEAFQALREPLGLLYGLTAILGITPLLAFAVIEIPFSEKAFATGLAIFCAVPTTLSSGVALVSAVRTTGHVAQSVALCVTW